MIRISRFMIRLIRFIRLMHGSRGSRWLRGWLKFSIIAPNWEQLVILITANTFQLVTAVVRRLGLAGSCWLPAGTTLVAA